MKVFDPQFPPQRQLIRFLFRPKGRKQRSDGATMLSKSFLQWMEQQAAETGPHLTHWTRLTPDEAETSTGSDFLEEHSPLSLQLSGEMAHCLKSSHLWGWLGRKFAEEKFRSCHWPSGGDRWRTEGTATREQTFTPTHRQKNRGRNKDAPRRRTMSGPELEELVGTVRV